MAFPNPAPKFPTTYLRRIFRGNFIEIPILSLQPMSLSTGCCYSGTTEDSDFLVKNPPTQLQALKKKLKAYLHRYIPSPPEYAKVQQWWKLHLIQLNISQRRQSAAIVLLPALFFVLLLASLQLRSTFHRGPFPTTLSGPRKNHDKKLTTDRYRTKRWLWGNLALLLKKRNTMNSTGSRRRRSSPWWKRQRLLRG